MAIQTPDKQLSTDEASRHLQNEWTATVAMIAAIAALIPVILVVLFASQRIDQLQGWFGLIPAAITTFLAIIAVGAAAMALDGKLTFRVGVGVTIGYFLGVMALAGAVMIFFPLQTHLRWGWFIILPAALLGVLSLLLINRLRRRRQPAIDAATQTS